MTLSIAYRPCPLANLHFLHFVFKIIHINYMKPTLYLHSNLHLIKNTRSLDLLRWLDLASTGR